MQLKQNYPSLIGQSVFLSTVLLFSSAALSDTINNPQCSTTATGTWAEQQVYLLFESDAQQLRRLECIETANDAEKQALLDREYTTEDFSDELFRKKAGETRNLTVSDQALDDNGMQVLGPPAGDDDHNQSPTIPTLRGFKTLKVED